MLLSVDRHVALGEQSFTVAVLLVPVTRPMYWLRLFCEVFVSVQSENTVHPAASEPRYGIAGSLNPTPPTVDQVRFSSIKTTMCL